VELPLHPDFGLWILHNTPVKLISWIAQKQTDRILGESGCARIIWCVFPNAIFGLSGSSAPPQFRGAVDPCYDRHEIMAALDTRRRPITLEGKSGQERCL
jgi:hypothetical protein